MRLTVTLTLLAFGCGVVHAQDNSTATNGTAPAPAPAPVKFVFRGLIANEDNKFDEKAWEKRINKMPGEKKSKFKRVELANAGLSKHDSETEIDRQIVGGAKAKKSQFPWQALIQMDGQYMCGGSLIDPKWILTAAHCAHGMSTFKVSLGGISVSDEAEEGEVVLESTEAFTHENYDDSLLLNDIALIKLPEAVDTSKGTIKTVRLPKATDAKKNYVSSQCTISGYGKIGDDKDPSNELKFVKRKVINNKVCARLYRDTITSASLCIRNTDMQGTCQGDSGGPFVCRDKDKKYTQIGLVSFGSAISCVKYPSGFTRIASHLTWITDTMAAHA